MQLAAYPYQTVPERGTLVCFLVALLMHLLLGVLLYVGVHWHSAEPEGVAAELWDPIPEAVQPPATPAPAVKPTDVQDADISLQDKLHKTERAKPDEATAQRERQARLDATRREAERKAAEAQQQANRAQRQSELARLQAQAGAASTNTGSGTSGKPSSGYAERVRQRVKPNIHFNDDVAGNPAAVVAVQMAPDGAVLSSKLVKSSGNSGWDNAVLRAVSLSNPLPRDESGVAPSEIRITFWPKDQAGS